MTADLTSTTAAGSGLEGKCAGCGGELKDGQALMALDKHYHVWCFKCKACSTLLHGEYMGKDGQPYCEKCYQSHFGVKCSYCFRFISGKVRYVRQLLSYYSLFFQHFSLNSRLAKLKKSAKLKEFFLNSSKILS